MGGVGLVGRGQGEGGGTDDQVFKLKTVFGDSK